MSLSRFGSILVFIVVGLWGAVASAQGSADAKGGASPLGFLPESQIVKAGSAQELLAQRRPSKRRARRPARRPRRSARRSSSVTVPIDIGVAPTFNFMTGPIQQDQLFHTGIRFSVAAVINRELLRDQMHRVPAQYRSALKNTEEVRYNPYSLFTPHSLIISPKIYDTGVYGIAFRPLAVGLALTPSPVRLSVDGGLMLQYMFIHSDTLPSPTHFIRPGAEFRVDLEFPIIPNEVLMSLGWASQLYPPQRVGGYPWEWSPLGETIWHVGQAYLMLHIRAPYTTTM